MQRSIKRIIGSILKQKHIKNNENICTKGTDISNNNEVDLHYFTEAPRSSPGLQKIPKNKQYVCKYCENNFSRSSNLTRHLKICVNKNNEIIQLKNKFEKKEYELTLANKTLNEQVELAAKESKYFKAENDYHKKMLNEAG